jgi:peptidoglycan hydrolase-like protein with peptidoglycan-binding domain
MPGPSLNELINRAESLADGYNAYNCGTYTDRNGRQVMLPKTGGEIDFSTMTIAEVQRRQNLPPGDPDRLGAVGMYQVIRGTLASAVTNLGLDPNQPFTPEIQDLIYAQYLLDDKRPEIRAYVTGQPGATLQAAQNGLAREWASFGSPENGGRGRYDGDGVNHASVSVAESAAALERMRTDYQAGMAAGLSPNAAWAATLDADKARNDLATTPTPGAKDPLVDGILQRGESGAAVLRLQENLVALGVQFHDSNGKPMAPTGFYGEQTAQAVRDFQKSHGIEPTGVADMRTLNAINAAANPQQVQTPPAPQPSANQTTPRDPLADNILKPGESGAAVLRLQQNLATLGVQFHDSNGKPIAPTGFYGEQTAQAVRDFQQSHGIAPTGVADMRTLNAINAAANPQQVQTPPTAQPTANQPASRDPLADNVLQRGESGAAVLRLQQNLVILGMPFHDANGKPIAPTGVYGEQTENRVRNFQQSHGLPATGVADMQTLNAINAAAQQQQQTQSNRPQSFADVMQIILPQSQAGKPTHITSDFGPRDVAPKNHTGVDFNYVGGQTGTNLQHPVVHSPVSGVVIRSGGAYGTVSIRDDQGNIHEILHLDSRLVQPPQRVQAGDPIGTMGGTGPNGPNTFAQHVHYQIINPQGQFVDPEQFWGQQRTQSRSNTTREFANSFDPVSATRQESATSDRYQTRFDPTSMPVLQHSISSAGAPLLSSEQHLHNSVYRDILTKVHMVEAERNIAHGKHSESLAGVLTLSSIRENMRPDRVEMSIDGSITRLVQISALRDEPSLNRYSQHIDTHQAMHRPFHEISQQVLAAGSVGMQSSEERQPPQMIAQTTR